MRWTTSNPPTVCKGWKADEIERGVKAANAVFEHTDSEGVALFACMIAAGKGKTARMRAGIVTDGVEAMTFALETLTELGIETHYDGIVISGDARSEFSKSVDFEAFAPGTWVGSMGPMPFSRGDIEDIAKTFATLEKYHKVPLKFGHNDEQPFTDGQPALGWVVKAWVNQDGKLMLRAHHVPDVVRRAITEKLYRKVSIELDRDVEHKGKFYRYVLSGVALLGADIPAVNTLADLDHYIDKPALAASRRDVFSAIQGQKENEVSDMTPQEIQKAIADGIAAAIAPLQTQFSSENAALKEQVTKLTKERDDGAKAQQAEKVKMARDTITGKLEAAVKQNLILPAQREYFIAQGVSDDAKVTTLDVDAFIKMSSCKTVDMSKDTGKNKTDERVEQDAGAEIVRLTRIELSKDSALGWGKAKERVLRANPELANEYLPEPA